MPRLIRLVATIALVSIGLGLGAMLIGEPFILVDEYGRTANNERRTMFIKQLGIGVALISAIIFTIRPTLLGPLYKKKPDDQA